MDGYLGRVVCLLLSAARKEGMRRLEIPTGVNKGWRVSCRAGRAKGKRWLVCFVGQERDPWMERADDDANLSVATLRVNCSGIPQPL